MIDALTLTPPWDWLILHAHKDPENRKWKTSRKGWILLHASSAMPEEEYEAACAMAQRAGFQRNLPPPETIPRGCITGAVRIRGCIHHDEQVRMGFDTRWAMPGQYGFLLAEPIALPHVPAKGALSFWKVPRHVREQVLAKCIATQLVLPAALLAMLRDDDPDEEEPSQGVLF